MSKTLTANTAKDLGGNIQVHGDPDIWKMICKVAGQTEGFSKTTRAMEIPGLGCLVKTSEHQVNHQGGAVVISQALEMVYKAELKEVGKDLYQLVATKVPEPAVITETPAPNKPFFSKKKSK